eukprot:COSAG02_NODE_4950_length_4796_cov_7.041729_1_plen_85_part_00
MYGTAAVLYRTTCMIVPYTVPCTPGEHREIQYCLTGIMPDYAPLLRLCPVASIMLEPCNYAFQNASIIGWGQDNGHKGLMPVVD